MESLILYIMCLSFSVFCVNSQPEFGVYYGYKADVTYDGAISACESLGLRLAKMDDESKWNKAKEYVKQYDSSFNSDGDHFWIGLKYDTVTGQHKWWDGSPLDFTTAWKDGEPQDVINKPCTRVEHSDSFEWKSKDCSEGRDYLCEGSDVFVGLEYTSQFTFVDGTSYTPPGSPGVLPWYNSEPNNIGSENCIRLYSSGSYKWRTSSCTSTFRYICTKSWPSTTTTTTTTISTTTTTTSTTTATTPTTTTTPPTTTMPSTTTTVAPTKPWWWVEYGADGLAIGQNGMSFKESKAEVKSGIIGLAIGFSTFFIVTIITCVCWFRCCKKHADKLITREDEEDEKKKDETIFNPVVEESRDLKYYT